MQINRTTKRIGATIAIWSFLLIVGIGFSSTAQAQQPYRVSDRQISDILHRLERNSGRFRNSLDASLDRSRTDGTRAEDDINAFVRDFDNSVEQLKQRFNDRRSVSADVETVLQKAAVIDNFMGRNFAARSENDWVAVKTDLDALAGAYGVGWQWNQQTSDGYRNRDRNDNSQRNGRNWDRYDNYGGSFDLRQTALNAGYNEGIRVGQKDRNRNSNSNSDYRNSSEYQKATKDYSSRLGDRELYRRYYRAGFQNGYNDAFGTQAYGYPQGGDVGYRNRDWNNNGDPNDNRDRRGRNWDRYDNYGGSFELRQTALNAGYNEGIKEGRNDRSKNNRSDFRNKSAYQKATTDYNSKFGDRGMYQRYYRAGYENGYYDGLNGN